MKSILIALGIIVIGGVVWYAIQTKPDASIQEAQVSDVTTTTNNESEIKASENETTQTASDKEIDNANVKITFKGFGPGKVHEGSFGKVDSKLAFDGSDIKGEVMVDMNSLSTEISKVTTDLKSKTFFEVSKYPTATFKVTSFKDNKLSGVMTVHGVSKNVTVDVKSSATELSSTFNIDMKEFGIDQKLANEVVELTVTAPLK